MPSSFRQNSLFKGDVTRFKLNACVGNNGGPYDLHAYALGYFDAADIIMQNILKGAWNLDLLIYPACFNFRHGVELSIKDLVNNLSKLHGSSKTYKVSHLLSDNWNIAKNQMILLKIINNEEITLMDKLISDFAEVDPKGEVFRYPESIKGNKYLEEWSLMNVGIIKERFDPARKVLDNWHYEIMELIQWENENHQNN